ncbi:DUF4097 family beta strand repeat-containing protein [Paenibacillus glufosinatiresistens]|uniref:DUF4097 family beta strand repeat-containing protein n=1 Tax=Paenibacillus glufosinatiresistens TaxID=3070657 RepID=UPI00286E3439|nr:DUF4097 family beta strand repeat-containing protein [Paenibacillus sp. YX.27]
MGKWRTGSLTAALGCIALGVLLVLIQLGTLDDQALGYVWPALLIALGLETLFRLLFRTGGGRTNGWAIVLIIAIGLGSAVPSVLGDGTLKEWFGKKYLSQVQGEKEIGAQIRQVRISITTGKIRLTGTENETVTYEGKLRSPGTSQSESDAALNKNWSVREEGDTLILEQKAPSKWSTLIFGFSKGPYLNVTLPSRLAATLSTSDGTLDVTGMENGLNADTSNGKVVIQDVRGKVHADTSNGSLVLRRIDGGVEASSSNGSITLEQLGGEVSASSSNGKIVIDSAIGGDWDCETSNGSIHLTVPQETDALIKADTSSGSLEGNADWNKKDNDSTSGDVKLGGGSHTVQLSTTNGDVEANVE